MLTIRQSQLDAFETAQRERFEVEAVAHVRDRLPEYYAALGEKQTLQAVREAMADASAYGLETPVGVNVYIRLAFVLGPDFATDHVWARDVLADRDANEYARVENLCAGAAKNALRGDVS